MRAGDFPWILDLDSWSLFGTLNLIWAAPRRLDHVAAAAEPTSRYRRGRFSIRPRGTISRRRHQIAVNSCPKIHHSRRKPTRRQRHTLWPHTRLDNLYIYHTRQTSARPNFTAQTISPRRPHTSHTRHKPNRAVLSPRALTSAQPTDPPPSRCETTILPAPAPDGPHAPRARAS